MDDSATDWVSPNEDLDYTLDPLPPPILSILKYLPAPRDLMDRQQQGLPLEPARWVFAGDLPRTATHLMPCVGQGSVPVQAQRLLSLQEAAMDYSPGSRKQVQKGKCSLWQAYGQRKAVYSRFESSPSKSNFAGVMPRVGGKVGGKASELLPPIKGVAKGSVVFDSQFQSGNLLLAYLGDSEPGIESFDLILQNDTNTRGHNQWFYFKMTSTKGNLRVRINIVNLVKPESAFSYGLQPLVYSDRQGQLGWHRAGTRVSYTPNHLIRDNQQSYRTLSFEYQFKGGPDAVWVAPSHPYTYSQLNRFLASITTQQRYRSVLAIRPLARSIGQNLIPLLSISTGKNSNPKHLVWILARQHPVQTSGSYMAEAMVRYLLELVAEGRESSQSWLDEWSFKVVPMVNPDGVIHGNTRAELSGVDPNRVWKKPCPRVTPIIYQLKRMILRTKDQNALVLDLHAHSHHFGCFFYGNQGPGPLSQYRLLPSTLAHKDPRFSYKNCRFRGGHSGSARRALFTQLALPNLFTVECSLLGYLKTHRVANFTLQDIDDMAITILKLFFNQSSLIGQNNCQDVSYPDEGKDYCDAQSARSDSDVSEDEYPQVYSFARKAPKSKKKNQKNSSLHRPVPTPTDDSRTLQYLKPPLSKTKEQCRLAEYKTTPQPCKVHQHSVSNVITRNNNNKKECNKMPSKYIRSKLLSKAHRKLCESIKEQEIQNRVEVQIKTRVDSLTRVKVEAQVQVELNPLESLGSPPIRQRRLMVLGSGVDEKLILLGHNQVGTQVDVRNQQDAKENAATSIKLRPNRRLDYPTELQFFRH